MEEDNGGRPKTAKYLLDWLVRILIIFVSILTTAIFAHVRAISDRSHNLELRVERLENTYVQRDEFRDALSVRPTRSEIRADLDEIKQMIRDLREDLRQ